MQFRIAAFVTLALAAPACAEEGMWTLNNFPADKIAAAYGFKPDQT